MKRMMYLIAGIMLSMGIYSVESSARAGREPERQKAEEKQEVAVPAPEPYRGLRKRIAVSGFENRSGWRGEAALGDGMAEMLTTALHETGRFIVVERQAIEDILAEQRLREEGRLVETTAPTVGRLIGAQALIRGAVTEFESARTGGIGGIGIGGVGIGIGGKVASVAIDVRVYDTSTGEILHSHRAAGEARTRGLALGATVGGVTFGGAGFEKTPLGEATRKAIEDAVGFIIREMEHIPWQSSVIRIKDGLVYITGGEDMNVRKGDIFAVYSVGEEFIDPITGLSLGREEEKTGKIEVVDVKARLSRAKILEGEGFKRGDMVRER